MHIVVTVTAGAAVVAHESAMKLRVGACVSECACACAWRRRTGQHISCVQAHSPPNSFLVGLFSKKCCYLVFM